MSQDLRQQRREQHEMLLERTGNQAASQIAAEEARHRVKNPEFLKQIQDPDIDTDEFDFVEGESGPLFSGSQILGHRSEHFEDQQEMLNRNKVERMVAELSPGRLLRDDPLMNAIGQGIRGTKDHPDPTANPKYRGPLTSRQKRAVRDSAEVATTRQTLSIGGRGIDAVSAATVENRTVTNEEKDSKGIRGRAKEVFR